MELSFVDMDDVIDVNERLLEIHFKEIGVDVQLPIQRMTWQGSHGPFQALTKPDIRFGMELQDVSEVVKGCGFRCIYRNWKTAEPFAVSMPKDRGICRERRLMHW